MPAAPVPTFGHVPSVDPNTGQRLSGAAQRKLNARQQQARGQLLTLGTSHPDLAAVPAPPVSGGVAACEAWAASVNLRAVQLVQLGHEAERVKLIRSCVRKIGQLRVKARRSEKACELRMLTKRIKVDYLAEHPPTEDPLASCAWSYLQLCQVLHRICTQPGLDLQRTQDLVETLANAGFVPCAAAIAELIDSIKKGR